jgi:hypothetical protein
MATPEAEYVLYLSQLLRESKASGRGAYILESFTGSRRQSRYLQEDDPFWEAARENNPLWFADVRELIRNYELVS